MRIVCQDIDDFLYNIKKEGKDNVYRKVIYVSYVKRPLDKNKECVRWEILLQASTVIHVSSITGIKDEGEYLLEVGIECGIDYADASKELKGTERATKLKKQIQDFCHANGLTTRPGVIDM